MNIIDTRGNLFQNIQIVYNLMAYRRVHTFFHQVKMKGAKNISVPYFIFCSGTRTEKREEAENLILSKSWLVLASAPYAPHDSFFLSCAKTYYKEFLKGHILLITLCWIHLFGHLWKFHWCNRLKYLRM